MSASTTRPTEIRPTDWVIVPCAASERRASLEAEGWAVLMEQRAWDAVIMERRGTRNATRRQAA